MKHPFEEYLQDIHARDYTGNGDDIGEAFNDWVAELEVDELLEHGDNMANEIIKIKSSVK